MWNFSINPLEEARELSENYLGSRLMLCLQTHWLALYSNDEYHQISPVRLPQTGLDR
jgi:hypothetical protein